MDSNVLEISEKGKAIMFHMITEMTNFDYAHRNTFVGCYRDVCLQKDLSCNETEDEIVDATIDLMNKIYNA